jgi:actin-related protein
LPHPIPTLISESLRACDPELRQVLLGNVVLTGGGSLFSGFGDRLAAELTRTFPHVRAFLIAAVSIQKELLTVTQTKIHAPGNPIERRYGAWLGGSILASLGTFHQLWISKEEWDVCGSYILPDHGILTLTFPGTWEGDCRSEVQMSCVSIAFIDTFMSCTWSFVTTVHALRSWGFI